jgi:predicted nucleic acid-binding protein
VPTVGPGDYEDAAELYRASRHAGDTVRSLMDCLVASVAIRARLRLPHADRDFEGIARQGALELA